MVVLENKPEKEKELFKTLIPKDAKNGIEIGVLNGETSAFFLNEFPDLHLTGIDPLIPDSMEPGLIGSLDKIFENVGNNYDRFTFISSYSYSVSTSLGNNLYDFIFIDGSHLYEDVRQDYFLYLGKVKEGGLIFFHDSRMYRGGAPFHPGSSKFVDELIASGKHQLIGEAFSLTAFIK